MKPLPWALLAIATLVGGATCARVIEPLGLPGTSDAGTTNGEAAPPTAAFDAPQWTSDRGPSPSLCGVDPPPDKPVSVAWNCASTRCFRDPSLPLDVPGRFGAPEDPSPAAKPIVVYPLVGSLHPVNIADLTVQWRRATPLQTRFHIAVSGAATADFYVPCAPPVSMGPPPGQNECVYTLPDWAWLDIAAASAGQAIKITVAGTDAQGTAVATSAPVPVSFSPGKVEGGLYYWSTSNGTDFGTIFRMVFGGRQAKAFIAPGTPANPLECAGCHAVSRDGNVIAFSAKQPRGYLTVARTEQPDKPMVRPPDPLPAEGNANMVTLNPSGDLVLISYGAQGDDGKNGKIVVRKTADGSLVSTLDPAVLATAEQKVYFPEWSPDGQRIVATLANQDERPWSVNDGIIVTFPYNQGRFGAATTVVGRDPELFHYYPTWSPDGRWIVFASAPLAVKSYDNVRSRLRMVSVDGGRVYDLANATQGIGKTSTWPKFAPFVQADCNLMFITFNSKMDYGFLRPNSIEPDGGHPQLWMAAIDLRRLATGDPSTAPVWLPFQKLDQHNHLGFWTTKLACQTDAACSSGEHCAEGRCWLNVD